MLLFACVPVQIMKNICLVGANVNKQENLCLLKSNLFLTNLMERFRSTKTLDSYSWDATNHPIGPTHPSDGWGQKGCCMLTGIISLFKSWELSLHWSICECSQRPQTWLCHSRLWIGQLSALEQIINLYKPLNTVLPKVHIYTVDMNMQHYELCTNRCKNAS